MTMMDRLHFAKGIDPVANAFASTVRSDVYNMSGWYRGLFVVYCGVGTTGTSTITINACDDVVPSNRSAIAFRYRQILSGDTEGAQTAATTAGFTTTAGSSKIILCEFDASALAASGYGFVELTAVEVAASAVLGGIMFIQSEPRYRPAIATTTIV